MLAITNRDAPAAIQGPEDGEAAIPGVLDIVTRTSADALVIGCFDDTGLARSRQLTDKLVIGIGQASFHLAAAGRTILCSDHAFCVRSSNRREYRKSGFR